MTQEASRFERALALMPWGTQTNGKRPDLHLENAPYFFERGKGCKLQATDGRWFIDYRSALGPIILGYGHPVVKEAVRRQIDKGVLFSLASPLELELAERLTSLIPGLAQVRFLKSGNEVNHTAIRLARAYTGRDLIVTCGYHGHGDWFSCGTGAASNWGWPRKGNGVPAILDQLVIRMPYGDQEALDEIFEQHGDRIAGLIMVPYDWGETVPHAFVKRAREITEAYGSVLIFDQILTGFRLGIEGAQGYFDVIPDLTTYGKAIANGYPLAVFGGKHDVMQMLDQVMITTTHAGETLSLAAALATLDVMQAEPVFEHIWKMGARLQQGFNDLTKQNSSSARCFGLSPALQFRFSDDPDKDAARRRAFYQCLLAEGIFPSSIFLINYAHREEQIDATLDAMARALK